MAAEDHSPRLPLPYFAEGPVVAGFGRGSKELGIPTANFPEDVIKSLPDSFECGVYYGWAQVGNSPVYKMTMCVGWNPYYHNTVKTMETHILHEFEEDFYGQHLKIIVMGFIRPMCDFPSLDALIKAIQNDNQMARDLLEQEEHLQLKSNSFFNTPSINGTTPQPSSSESSAENPPSAENLKISSDKPNGMDKSVKINGLKEHEGLSENKLSQGDANGVVCQCNGGSKDVVTNGLSQNVTNGLSQNGDSNGSICRL